MTEIIIMQVFGLLCLTAVTTLLIIFNYKEAKYSKKINFLTDLLEAGYESDKIDLNNI